jgi:uncharacterized protein
MNRNIPPIIFRTKRQQMPIRANILVLLLIALCVSCDNKKSSMTVISPNPIPTVVSVDSPQIQKIIANAIEQTKVTRTYDPAYVKLAYPGGDVPMNTGVCTDVVIRAFRSINIDLQKEVHEDMRKNFAVYPRNWGLNSPDTNIDHRRVPNLMTWLKRQGKAKPVTQNGQDYQPGDIVTWDLGGGQQHIGLVTNIPVNSERLSIAHNVGSGAKVEDVLFKWKPIGHYRYL